MGQTGRRPVFASERGHRCGRRRDNHADGAGQVGTSGSLDGWGSGTNGGTSGGMAECASVHVCMVPLSAGVGALPRVSGRIVRVQVYERVGIAPCLRKWFERGLTLLSLLLCASCAFLAFSSVLSLFPAPRIQPFTSWHPILIMPCWSTCVGHLFDMRLAWQSRFVRLGL